MFMFNFILNKGFLFTLKDDTCARAHTHDMIHKFTSKYWMFWFKAMRTYRRLPATT